MKQSRLQVLCDIRPPDRNSFLLLLAGYLSFTPPVRAPHVLTVQYLVSQSCENLLWRADTQATASDMVDIIAKPRKGLNGHAGPSPMRRSPGARPSVASRLLNLVARIIAWIAIINVLFRCPETLNACDEASPLFCRQYHQIKNAASPILQPYYDTHAAPYVELARPYYDAIERAFINPAQAYAAKYAAPRLEDASAFAQQQWEEKVQPQLEKAQAIATEKYDETVAPRVDSLKDAVSPYIEIATTSALQTYYEVLLPTYVFTEPYARQAYGAASTFTTNTAIPSATWIFDKIYAFLDNILLPQLRLIYVDAVEPQLVRIGRRLGRYNGSKHKARTPDLASASAKAASSTFTKPTRVSASSGAPASATAGSEASSSSSIATPRTFDSTTSTEDSTGVDEAQPYRTDLLVQPPPAQEGESDLRRQAREEVTKDLVSWQEKFMNAAEEGAAEIEERVVDICQHMISEEVEVAGKQAVSRFVDSIAAGTAALRSEVRNIVEATQDKADASEQVTAAVRRAGISLKKEAQAIRNWRENFVDDIHRAINQAAHSHFEMLDDIKDLALQKMGMKWAWMDGVTYKDWKLYHDLKAEFMGWRDGLEESVVTHESLERAHNAAADVEDLGMDHARQAALELKRLKEVGHWKVIAADASDNFDTEEMRLAAQAVQKNSEKEDIAAETAEEGATAAGEAAAGTATPEEPSMDSITPKRAILEKLANEPEVRRSPAGSPGSRGPSGGDDAAAYEEGGEIDNASVHPGDNSGAPAQEEASSENQIERDNDPEANERSADSFNEMSTFAEVDVSLGTSELESASTMKVEAIPEHTASSSSNSGQVTDSLDSCPDGLPDQDTETETVAHQAAPKEDAKAQRDPESDSTIGSKDEMVELAEEDAATSEPVRYSAKPALFGAAAQSVPNETPALDDDADAEDMPDQVESLAQAAYSTAASLADMQLSLVESIVSVQIGTGTPKPIHGKMLASASSAHSQALASASSRLSSGLEAASANVLSDPTANSQAVGSSAGRASETAESLKDEL